MQLIRKVGSAILRYLQRLALFRSVIKRIVPAVSLREATNADFLSIAHMLAPQENPDQVIQAHPNITNWVAVYQGHLVGFVQLAHHPLEYFPFNGFWLFSLIVKTAWRGSGIGEGLSVKVIQRAKQEGASVLNLLVYNDNLPAIRLYQKLGFKVQTIPELQTQLDQEFVETGRRRILMQKQMEDQA